MYDPNDMNLAAIDEKVLQVAEIGASSTIYKGSKSGLGYLADGSSLHSWRFREANRTMDYH